MVKKSQLENLQVILLNMKAIKKGHIIGIKQFILKFMPQTNFFIMKKIRKNIKKWGLVLF